MKKCCGNCYWAKWKETPAGRRCSDNPGECTVPVILPKVPQAWSTKLFDHRMGIWLEYGDECETFLDKRTDPKSVGWTKERPKAPGFYWIRKNDRIWTIHVWCHKAEPEKLYTNEDGAASINDDELYGSAEFKGPFEP